MFEFNLTIEGFAGVVIYDNCLMQAVIEKTNLNPAEVGDIVVGTVLAPGSQRAIECRMAAFYAGFPGNMLSPFLHLISCKLHFCALVLNGLRVSLSLAFRPDLR